MISDNFIFKFGKHAGKTYAFVKDKNPQYIEWAEKNAPNLLKESKPKKQTDSQKSTEQKPIAKLGKLTDNTDFLNQTGH